MELADLVQLRFVSTLILLVVQKWLVVPSAICVVRLTVLDALNGSTMMESLLSWETEPAQLAATLDKALVHLPLAESVPTEARF